MNQTGINRIEILVVAGVIIVILFLAIYFILELQSNARDTKRKSDVETISKSLEAHYNRQEDEHCQGPVDSYCHPQGNWFYNNKIPSDPLTGVYLNLPKDGDKKFVICAKLENGGGNALDDRDTPGFGFAAQFFCRSNQQ